MNKQYNKVYTLLIVYWDPLHHGLESNPGTK